MKLPFSALLLLVSCPEGAPAEPPESTTTVPKEIVIYYNSGHFQPSLYRVSTETISFSPGGQYNTVDCYSGKILPVVYRNLWARLKHLDVSAMSRVEDLSKAFRDTPSQHFLLILVYGDKKAFALTIPHEDTVTRDDKVGEKLWFGEFLRDLKTLAIYHYDPGETPPAKGLDH